MSDEVIHIGVSPAGVEWNVYRKTHESYEKFEARADQMAATFARKYGVQEEDPAPRSDEELPETVRVRKLTQNQAYVLTDNLEVGGLVHTAGATYVEADRYDIEGAYGMLIEEDPFVDAYGESEAQQAMAYRVGWRSHFSLLGKLAKALGDVEGRRKWEYEARQVQKASAYDLLYGRYSG